jgi:hypothetical protein
MRAVLLMLTLASACGGQHVIGSIVFCCYDYAAGISVPTCQKDQPTCECFLELCGMSAFCQSDVDCATENLTLGKCMTCLSGHCIPTTGCLPPPPPHASSCNSDSQCNQVSGCVSCSDGSMACYVVRCLDGVCTVEPPSCSCGSDVDCASPESCQRCPDGATQRCLESRCTSGVCLVQPGPACPPTASCHSDGDCGKATCISCPQSGTACGRVWCADESCQTIPPSC